MYKAFEKIEKIIGKMLQKYSIEKDGLEEDGTVFYMNGNDSTKFDVEMNDRLCEFGAFHMNGYYAVKVLVMADETEVYVYPDSEHPQEYHREILDAIMEPDDFFDLAARIEKIESGFTFGPATRDWDRPMSVLIGQLQDAEENTIE